MKLTSVTGVTQVDNIKCFKPVCKIFVKTIYPNGYEGDHSNPNIRIRLVDGRVGSSMEIVPETRLFFLSEISSKFEGFQRRALRRYNGSVYSMEGHDISSILVGCQVGLGVGEECAAIDLSNDKYLDIDMRDLDPELTYEIWGVENHVINSNCRVYKNFYMSVGEIEKTFEIGENEILVYPIEQVKELQMYAKNGSSPVFRREELILDEDTRNDLVTVQLSADNEMLVAIDESEGEIYVPIAFGWSNYGVMDVTPYTRFDFRREDGLDSVKFLMIDTVPTLATVVANS